MVSSYRSNADTFLQAAVDRAHGINSLTNRFSANPNIAIKPAANILVSVGPGYTDDEDAAQYVATIADPTATTFGGSRFVFAFLHQKTLSIDTRLKVTFTTDLTLKLVAQPFISSGAYPSFRQFTRPRSVDKQVYGAVDPDGSRPANAFTIDNPDFTVRSLRGNAVLRWQYRPGSTVFLVWTQERSGYDAVGQFDLRGQSSEIFRERPVNIFLLKVNYGVGR